MRDSFFLKAPAKINLFLKIINKLSDGYHNIRSGITFLDLHNEINVKKSHVNQIQYSGNFQPPKGFFKDDLVLKILNESSKINNVFFSIYIKKNIPFSAGLASASTDAATILKFLQKNKLLKKEHLKKIFRLGSDIPICFYQNNCIVLEKGDKIIKDIEFPKYFFLLIKPNIGLNTKTMYSKIDNYIDYSKVDNNDFNVKKIIPEFDRGNDFEKIILREYNEIREIIEFLSSSENSLFSGMSGSGACCFATYYKKEEAKKALKVASEKYKNYWIQISENNTINY